MVEALSSVARMGQAAEKRFMATTNAAEVRDEAAAGRERHMQRVAVASETRPSEETSATHLDIRYSSGAPMVEAAHAQAEDGAKAAAERDASQNATLMRMSELVRKLYDIA